ncbi:MAG: NAD-dependent epimerase/dehydratase family protein [Thermoleophilaceae bacterium]
MRIFIAGATGAIGRPLTRRLLEAGHEVVGMTRTERRAARLREAGAEAVVADALDADAVRRTVEEARPDVVVNQLTDLNRSLNPRKYAAWLETTNRLRREGTGNLAHAARAAGAHRFVSQSVAFFYAFAPGTKTEDDPLLGPVAGEAAVALHDLERATLATDGLDGIVLRYGFFYGPGTSYARDGEQVERIRKRQMPIIGDGEGCFPFIHVEDAASATVAAIDRGAPGVYNIVDDEPAGGCDWIPYVADLAGAKKPWRVPAFVARWVAGPPAEMATKLQPVSNEKAKRELGWQPLYASWREGFRAELG